MNGLLSVVLVDIREPPIIRTSGSVIADSGWAMRGLRRCVKGDVPTKSYRDRNSGFAALRAEGGKAENEIDLQRLTGEALSFTLRFIRRIAGESSVPQSSRPQERLEHHQVAVRRKTNRLRLETR